MTIKLMTTATTDHASLMQSRHHMNRQYAFVGHGWTKRKPRGTITTVAEHAVHSKGSMSWCFPEAPCNAPLRGLLDIGSSCAAATPPLAAQVGSIGHRHGGRHNRRPCLRSRMYCAASVTATCFALDVTDREAVRSCFRASRISRHSRSAPSGCSLLRHYRRALPPLIISPNQRNRRLVPFFTDLSAALVAASIMEQPFRRSLTKVRAAPSTIRPSGDVHTRHACVRRTVVYTWMPLCAQESGARSAAAAWCTWRALWSACWRSEDAWCLSCA